MYEIQYTKKQAYHCYFSQISVITSQQGMSIPHFEPILNKARNESVSRLVFGLYQGRAFKIQNDGICIINEESSDVQENFGILIAGGLIVAGVFAALHVTPSAAADQPNAQLVRRGPGGGQAATLPVEHRSASSVQRGRLPPLIRLSCPATLG
jgi:hypothetical protein